MIAMKIMVAIKEVTELDDDFEIKGNQIEDKFFEYKLNEWDEYALEEAVGLREELDAVEEVFTVTVGPPRSDETIRMALAKGADRAVRVWDDELAGKNSLDPRVTARLLEPIARQEEPTLILSGVMSSDLLLSSTGLTLARLLDYQWSAVVNDLELDPGEGQARVHRELEGGTEELTEIDLPAVLTIQTGINSPRYASLRGIRQARKKELEVYGLEDLGLDEGVLRSPIDLKEMREPETKTETEFFEGSPADQAGRLVETLEDLGVVDR